MIAPTDSSFRTSTNELNFFLQVENIVGKGENAGYQHFLLFQQGFLKRPLSLGH